MLHQIAGFPFHPSVPDPASLPTTSAAYEAHQQLLASYPTARPISLTLIVTLPIYGYRTLN